MRFSVGCDPGQGNGEIGEIVLWIPEYGREVQTHPLPWLPAACRTNHCGSQSSWQFGPKLWLVYRPGCHTSLGPAVQNYFLVFENAACLPHLTRAFAHDVSHCLGCTVCPPPLSSSGERLTLRATSRTSPPLRSNPGRFIPTTLRPRTATPFTLRARARTRKPEGSNPSSVPVCSLDLGQDLCFAFHRCQMRHRYLPHRTVMRLEGANVY